MIASHLAATPVKLVDLAMDPPNKNDHFLWMQQPKCPNLWRTSEVSCVNYCTHGLKISKFMHLQMVLYVIYFNNAGFGLQQMTLTRI